MSRYDTNQKASLEPGIYKVTVKTYPQEKVVGGGFVKIDMEFSVEGAEYPIKQSYFPNQLTSMFVALGFKEVESGVFDGDIQEAYEKQFNAELYFEDYIKKDGTAGKARRLRNFTAIVPSLNPDGALVPSDIEWPE